MDETAPDDRDLLRPFRSMIAAQEAARTAAAEAERERDRRLESAAERGAARAANGGGDEALLTAAEVAELLSIRVDRVHALGRSGTLPRVKLGENTFRYRREAVLAALENLES